LTNGKIKKIKLNIKIFKKESKKFYKIPPLMLRGEDKNYFIILYSLKANYYFCNNGGEQFRGRNDKKKRINNKNFNDLKANYYVSNNLGDVGKIHD